MCTSPFLAYCVSGAVTGWLPSRSGLDSGPRGVGTFVVGGRGRAAFFGADPRRVAAGMACTILGIGLVVGARVHARSFGGHPVRPVVLASATPVASRSL